MSEQIELLLYVSFIGKKGSGKTSIINYLNEYYEQNITIKDEELGITYKIVLQDDTIDDNTTCVMILCDPFEIPSTSDIVIIMAQNYLHKVAYCMMGTKVDLIKGTDLEPIISEYVEPIAKLFPPSNLFTISVVDPSSSYYPIDETVKKIAKIASKTYFSNYGITVEKRHRFSRSHDYDYDIGLSQVA